MTLASKNNKVLTGARDSLDGSQRVRSVNSPASATQDNSDQEQEQQIDVDEVFLSTEIGYTGDQREAFREGYRAGMELAHTDSAEVSWVEMSEIEHTAMSSTNAGGSINIEFPSDPEDDSAASSYAEEAKPSATTDKVDQSTENSSPSKSDVKSFARFVAISAAALIVAGILGWTQGVIPAPIALGGSILLVVLLVFTTNLQVFLSIE